MPKRNRKKGTDFTELLDRYKNISVVSEIEKNLAQKKRENYPENVLYLSPFYDERNYDLSLYPTLRDSLLQEGFLIPLIIVKGKKEGSYEIINGVKRYLFAKEMKMKEIPCVLAEISEERKRAYLVENIIAEGGCALTRTTCFLRLKEDYCYQEKDIASLSGMSLSQVKNLLRLALLPDFLKDALRTYKISYGMARSLLNLPLEEQKVLYEKALREHLSVRDVEAEKRLFAGREKKTDIKLKNNRITLTFPNREKAKNAYERLEREFRN